MDFLESIDFTQPGVAELYDELPLWSAPFGLMLLERVPLCARSTYLDVGAGTGWLTIELAERAGANCTVIAVDPWAAGLDRLCRKVQQRQLTNIQLLQLDAAALQLPDASVDCIVSNLGINNFDDPRAVLNACWRVAKPQAALLLTTNPTGHMGEFYDVFRATLEALGQRDRLPHLDAHIAHRGSAESVTQLVRAAGFTVTELDTGSFRMRFADGAALLHHHFIRLGFLSGWKSVVGPNDLPQTFDALRRNLDALASERGELALTVPMLCLSARKEVRCP